MAVGATQWLDLIRREYLSRFISSGGSAVKFVVAQDGVLGHVHKRLESMAKERRDGTASHAPQSAKLRPPAISHYASWAIVSPISQGCPASAR